MLCMKEKTWVMYEEADVDEKKERWETVVCTLSPWFHIKTIPSNLCPDNMTLATLTALHGSPPCLNWSHLMLTAKHDICPSQLWVYSYSSARAFSWPLPMSKPGWNFQANSHLIHIYLCLRPTKMYDTVHCQGVDLKYGDVKCGVCLFYVVFNE